jgi:hypothetical protein
MERLNSADTSKHRKWLIVPANLCNLWILAGFRRFLHSLGCRAGFKIDRTGAERMERI